MSLLFVAYETESRVMEIVGLRPNIVTEARNWKSFSGGGHVVIHERAMKHCVVLVL